VHEPTDGRQVGLGDRVEDGLHRLRLGDGNRSWQKGMHKHEPSPPVIHFGARVAHPEGR
jgi:hypothetical protein